MDKGRLEAFSDGVMAIIITIIVLLLEAPKGENIADLMAMLPLVFVYTVSFVMIGTNWANHHHLLKLAKRIDGRVIWANHFYLFTLSFYPVATAWVGSTNYAMVPTALYASVNLVESLAFILVEKAVIAANDCAMLRATVGKGRKEILTILLELAALGCAFLPSARFMSYALLLAMTLLWIVPDVRMRRIYEKSVGV